MQLAPEKFLFRREKEKKKEYCNETLKLLNKLKYEVSSHWTCSIIMINCAVRPKSLYLSTVTRNSTNSIAFFSKQGYFLPVTLLLRISFRIYICHNDTWLVPTTIPHPLIMAHEIFTPSHFYFYRFTPSIFHSRPLIFQLRVDAAL